ncbi:MAG TPA: Holliday junction branch migration protein RuvA [Chloroflexi bacterium]|nr:Holliday junction branch migration protein RuvA [Chloroflexota bacterium]
MIARLSGTVWHIGEEHVVVRCGGVGFHVQTSTDVLDQLSGVEKPIELYTYMHVRENDLSLFGFLTQDALALFKLLLDVSGVGPKAALALLSTLAPNIFRQAVAQDEPQVLTRAPGIGPKTAKAIIFHLKDKITFAEAEIAPMVSDTNIEVIDTLTGLGFSLVEAQAAVQSLPQDKDLTVEESVRQALAYFAAS